MSKKAWRLTKKRKEIILLLNTKEILTFYNKAVLREFSFKEIVRHCEGEEALDYFSPYSETKIVKENYQQRYWRIMEDLVKLGIVEKIGGGKRGYRMTYKLTQKGEDIANSLP